MIQIDCLNEKAGHMNIKRLKIVCKEKIVLLLAVFLLGSFYITGCQDEKTLEEQQKFRQQGINKLNEGNYKEAVEAFQKALDQSQAEVGKMELDICYYKATAQYNSGDTDGALTTCNAVINYNAKDAKAYFIRGSVYLKEGDSEKARKDYAKALDLCGKDYALYLAVYENLAGTGFQDEADELIEKALELKGDKPEDYRERGHIYLIQEDYENAGNELDKAINKGDVKALLYLAQVYEAQGSKNQAQALYESYLDKNGSDVATLTSLAEMQMEAGEYQRALEYFQKALSTEQPENEKNIRRNEIICYENLLDFASAKEKMASYVKDYPEDEEAKRENIFLQTR
ncbi:MAG: tetratricopeptide repeat protein [Lachnospiraceae bacterium]|mgnify:CR=1 FL=1